MARGTRQGAQGTSMQGAEQSPQRTRRRAKQRARQDERWAARSGDVSIRQMTEAERQSFKAATGGGDHDDDKA